MLNGLALFWSVEAFFYVSFPVWLGGVQYNLERSASKRRNVTEVCRNWKELFFGVTAFFFSRRYVFIFYFSFIRETRWSSNAFQHAIVM